MKKIIIGFLAIILLTGCSETTHNNYKFTGESDHWEAVYSYKGTEKWGEKNGVVTYSSEDTDEFVLEYKGSVEELSSLQNLEYAYEAFGRSSKRTEEFTEPLTTKVFTNSGSTKGAAKVNEDETILVKVKWDDLEETILLENKGK